MLFLKMSDEQTKRPNRQPIRIPEGSGRFDLLAQHGDRLGGLGPSAPNTVSLCDLIAAEIIEDLRAALDEFAAIQGDLAADRELAATAD